MTARHLGARRRLWRAATWIAATAAGGTAWAQSSYEVPEPVGFPAGPVVIAPSLTAGYSYNTNVLQRSADATPPPSPDGVLTLQPAVHLTVPFSNSSFRVGDVLTYIDYKNTPQFTGKTTNDAVADLTLRFGSLDTLELSAHNINGVADSYAVNPEGLAGFQGNPYLFHSEGVSLSREIDGVRGYRLALERNAMRFDPSITVNFINYRGFDGEAAYLQPLSSNTRLSFGYEGSEYDQSSASDPSTVIRTESGNAFYGEVEGRFGSKQPYRARLGWKQLAFTDTGANVSESFSGVVGDAKLTALVGGGTALEVTAIRQPYRSSLEDNNFYVMNYVVGRVSRTFPQGSTVGGALSLQSNSYGASTVEGIPDELRYRKDEIVRTEAYAILTLAKRVGFRVSFARNRKYSNYPGSDYTENVFSGGFVLGWI